jgi:hypothetical protein
MQAVQGADMALSLKAQEIHDYIVDSNKTDYWIGVAKSLIKHKGQFDPGPPYTYDVSALKQRLKAELSGAVRDAIDNHWEEIADWLFNEAKPG